MRLFGSHALKPGWLCIQLMPDRVDLSHVAAGREARPEILLCDSYRKEGGDVATLGRLRRELRLAEYRCTTLLRPGQYQVVQVEAPRVAPEELKSALRWQIKDLVDFPVEMATVDALQVPPLEKLPTPGRKLLAVAARNDTIAAAMQPFEEAGVLLRAIDIPELAQRNVAHWFEQPGRALALLAFEGEEGLLTFTSDGELYQYRRIDIAASGLADGDLERRVQTYERLVLELQRSLDHFDRQFAAVPVSGLVVVPVPGAGDLQAHLAANLDIPVTAFDLSSAMDCTRIPELREPARQAACLQVVGGALRTEGQP